ncbi:MAG: CcdB family protein [Rhodospirillales bacterium]|nr:CcdB family protein [Rhodospirillales bacterium]
MARFDVHEYGSSDVPFVIDVQADLLSGLKSRVVVPLLRAPLNDEKFFPRLNPVIIINEERYILMTADIGSESCDALGKKVANLEDRYRQEITDALDFLFQGF